MSSYELSEKVLDLPIKGRWYDDIMALQKGEEYREIKPYWTKRLQNAGLLDENGEPVPGMIGQALMHAGYRPESRRAMIRFLLRKGHGRPEWGAEPGREYYILSVISRSRAV